MNGIATNEQQVFEKSPSLSARWAKTIFTKLVANIRYGQIVLHTGLVIARDKRLVAMVTPAEGPSLGVAPSGTWR